MSINALAKKQPNNVTSSGTYLFLLVSLFIFILGVMSSSASAQTSVGLYEVWEIEIINGNSYSNPFDFAEIELRATFTAPSGRTFDVIGFYDGDGQGGQTGNVWKLRFMPDEIGTWSYSHTWTDGTPGGVASFEVTGLRNARNHGHVHVDPARPRYLIYDDGRPHYWWGANWIDSTAFGPPSKWGRANPYYVTNEQFITHLDLLETFEHNGLLLKMALFPLEDDQYSWDLVWLHREEWLLRQMLNRGIYAQINIFDTWSRVPSSWRSDTDGDRHVFNVWESGDEGAKQNYIKSIVARFAGFPNVYWELGNEMEHPPNSGSAFVNQANSKYIPWIRQADPYDLPIGLSEEVWQSADVDIGFLHQADNLPESSWDQPTVINELVSGGITSDLWEDETIRDGTNRIAYRRTFWRMFTYGGTGSSEATWLEFTDPPNQAVLSVMADQQRLRTFIERLPVNINEMYPLDGFVRSGPGDYSTRGKAGRTYVTYFLLSPEQTRSSGTVEVNLPPGTYWVEWYDPKNGPATTPIIVTTEGGVVTLSRPAFTEDITLRASVLSFVYLPTILKE